MNGMHDMGGMHGFGPVVRKANEPVFHHEWEGRVYAMQRVTPVPIPGGSRNNIETMDPEAYLTSSYYEKWLHSRIKGLIDAGALTAEELEARVAFYRDHPEAPVPRREDPASQQRIQERLRRVVESPRLDLPIQPQYRIGAAVRARNMHPPGHTRLPRYVRGKRGVVERFYGIYAFQDAMPAGTTASPQPLYAVRFDAGELWGESADVNSVVYIDMWESYLESA
jgi:nitrile hydratase subunit beta